jgi:sulfoxide reductase heme-binding subunit YedZ
MAAQTRTRIIPQYLEKNWFLLAVHVASLWPLAWLLWDFFMGNLIDPLGEITNRTGYTALVLLVLSLAATPLNTLTGFRKLVQARKWFGLYGFFYVVLHLFTFIGLDYAFNFEYIFGDALLSKRYVIVGFTAFLRLIPLAITSTKGWQRRLGRNWTRLHRLVYVAGAAGVVHFIWIQKSDITEPLKWAAALAVLLGIRVWFAIRARSVRARSAVTV